MTILSTILIFSFFSTFFLFIWMYIPTYPKPDEYKPIEYVQKHVLQNDLQYTILLVDTNGTTAWFMNGYKLCSFHAIKTYEKLIPNLQRISDFDEDRRMRPFSS